VSTTRAAGVSAPPTTVLPKAPPSAPSRSAPPAPPAARRRRIRPAVLIAAIATIALVAVAVIVGEQLLHARSNQTSNNATSAPPPSTGAAPSSAPSIQLSRYITDQAGVLAPAGRVAVERAIDKLYADRKVRLWVAYINTFSGLKPLKWAEDTMRANGLTDLDALLAIATDGRSFSFRVPAAVTNGTAINVETIRRDRIEPAVSRGEWARAAVAAVNGLETPAR
jgi:serine/threonine protein kinase, bacterial